jgi:hypothetical protein
MPFVIRSSASAPGAIDSSAPHASPAASALTGGP